jgi:hypothetical protein
LQSAPTGGAVNEDSDETETEDDSGSGSKPGPTPKKKGSRAYIPIQKQVLQAMDEHLTNSAYANANLKTAEFVTPSSSTCTVRNTGQCYLRVTSNQNLANFLDVAHNDNDQFREACPTFCGRLGMHALL